jgi:hypothetical protein
MKRALPLVFAATLAVAGARAAPLQRDLGQGLAYVRVHELTADLAAASAAGHPTVLDLRYVAGGPPEAADLFAWLKRHAGPRTPVFLLANSATSAALLAPLNSPEAVTGLVILGAAAPGFEPDIPLAVAPEAERRAYDALERGAPIDSLVIAKTDKVRNDEAVLAKARLADPAGDEDDEPKAPEKPRPVPPPQTIDPVLQRAVQLDRSLLALKRL